MRDPPPSNPLRVSWWAALLTIAATYFYFLIFAEFAFLELAGRRAGTGASLQFLMLGLGGGGVIGAGMAAWRFVAGKAAMQLAWTLRGCAISAALALSANNFVTLSAAGFAVGLCLGALTVVLASSLQAATAGRRLGLCIGAGTGLAYALCNLPWLFRAAASTQTLLAAGVVGVASLLPRYMRAPIPEHVLAATGRNLGPRASRPYPGVGGPEARGPRESRCFLTAFAAERAGATNRRAGILVRWTTILLTLVWMDSAAFYIVQHNAALHAATWASTGMLFSNAFVHLGAAVVAGVLLDRGFRAGIAVVSVLTLATALLILNGTMAAILPAAWFYTAGVSLYSTVLVEYPARDGRPGVAAIVFAIAGWMGSALGIGMAQNLATVPVLFVVIAVTAVGVALSWRPRAAGRIAVAALWLAVFGGNVRGDDIAIGREVYIAEGCIHCHSQYVRPNSALDVQRWGPATLLRESLAGEPPLFGARRLGPDLSHVGNRRAAEWNRLHLIAPEAVSPGSRMPSYAHLFAAGDRRGDALVAYLASLGAESLEQRWRQVAAWQPRVDPVISLDRARSLFLRLCAQCHGESGRGDGALAARLSLGPPDWTQSAWRHVPAGAQREVVLSRIIKFGLPGLVMGGHEYLPDAEIVGLARFVQSLHVMGGGGPTAAVQP